MKENILIIESSQDYELLDSGDKEKLERYGEVTISRPDPQVLWPKSLPKSKWDDISAKFERIGVKGKWRIIKEIPEDWRISLEDITFSLKLLPSKHIGLFPEQLAHWDWLSEKIKTQLGHPMSKLRKKVSVLNLFGYTGGASLTCAHAGADVVHVDSSKFVVDIAKENAKLSKLSDKPIRYIVDDVRKFVEREIKRGNKYDIILMDPPVYGKGLKNEIWKIDENLMPLLLRIKSILSVEPLAIVLNGYASDYSHITYAQMLSVITADLGGQVSSGELFIKESSAGRLLSCGIFARWEE